MRAAAGQSKRSSLNAARRQRELDDLAGGETVDVLVIGGGITGVGVALDAATRGLSVALVERNDLASGTSGWSSKLVHGGLRYLRSGDVGLAYESATERGILMEHTAPHLTRPLTMVVPVGVGMRRTDALPLGVGFALGNGLRMAAGTSSVTLPRPRWAGVAETLRLAPALRRRGLVGSLVSWDGQLVDDVRLVVAIARTAAAFGARVLTHCSAVHADGTGAQLVDQRSGDRFPIHARAVVNATGVWADTLDENVRLRPSKGVHLVVRSERLGNPSAQIAVPIRGSSSRFAFVLPQLDGRCYIGITDDPVDTVEDVPRAEPADIEFLLAAVGHVLDVPLTHDDVIGTFAGLRPLLAKGDGHTSDLSRRHRIIRDPDGMLTIVGGKLTTYRRMAEDVVDQVAAGHAGAVGPCRTTRQPLVGALPRQRLAQLRAAPWLVQRYGAEALDVEGLIRDNPALGEPVAEGSPYLRAELAWSVAHEGALSVGDLLDRRTRIGLVAPEREAAMAAAEEALAAATVPAGR